MKTVFGILLGLLIVYQLGFRYEHWTDSAKAGLVYERDNLTGQVHEIKPGQKVDFIARLLGKYGDGESSTQMPKEAPPEPFAMAAIGTTAESAKNADKDAAAAAKAIESFVTRQIDLNSDGAPEEIIQSVTTDDGLLDISIVREGRELFYARGKQLNILPTQQDGWSDLMMSPDGQSEVYFRYQADLNGYKRLAGRPAL